jgi:hypothetical protein
MKAQIVFAIVGILVAEVACAAPADLLEGYRNSGAGPFSAAAGAAAWVREHPAPGAGDPRSCASCHGTDLRAPGRHLTTGKRIAPMAVSVNAERMSDPNRVEKWLRRNCRWTLGRECTPQEKGDFVLFLLNQ